MKFRVLVLISALLCIISAGCSEKDISSLLSNKHNLDTSFSNFESVPSNEVSSNVVQKDKKLVFLIYQYDYLIDSLIEEKLNALLNSRERDYTVDIVGLTRDEMELSTIHKAEDMLHKKEQLDILCCGGMEVNGVNPYEYCISNGYFIELDDFLTSKKGSKLYNAFDEMVWDRVRNSNGKIYGINNCTALGDSIGFAYDSEICSYYDFHFEEFWKDMLSAEPIFSKMINSKITPVCLDRYDLLLDNYIGMDVYRNIFMLKHQNDEVEAYNFLDDPNIIEKYKSLGELRAKGYLTYSEYIKEEFSSDKSFQLNKSCDSFQYIFTIINNNLNVTSDKIVINCNNDDMPLLVDLYIPKENNYSYINDYRMQTGVLESSKYKDESLDFLQLIYTDEEIGSLLSYGIEGRQFLVNNDRLIFNTNTEILESPKVFPVDSTRYFPIQRLQEKYQDERKNMNSNIQNGALYQDMVDFTGLKKEYEECNKLFNEYALAFIGYYEDETEEKLSELNEKLKLAGYEELLDYINSYIVNKGVNIG